MTSLRQRSTRGLPPDARCRDCRYPLRDLPQPRCPECGTTFDPCDPDSYMWSGRVPPLARKLRTPPGRAYYRIVLLASIITICTFSAPGYSIWPAAATGLLWALLLLYWLSRAGLGLVATMYAPAGFTLTDDAARRRWLIAPVALLALLFGVILDVPRRARLAVGFPQLVTLRDDLAAASAGGPLPDVQWLGAYPIQRVGRHNHAILFDTDFYECGFAWSPTRPANCYERVFTHMFGNWYIWEHEPFRGCFINRTAEFLYLLR